MKRLLLLGGGHAHVHVLRELAREPMPATQVTLVSPFPRQLYSGMVPGLVAGHYAVDDCVIPLPPLASAAGVTFVQASATALDTGARCVSLSNGDCLGYDTLSLDTGPVMPTGVVTGADEYAWPVRPIETFIARWQALLDQHTGELAGSLVVIGGGAAGVELAMAFKYRLGSAVAVAIVTGGGPVLGGQSGGLQRRATRALKRCGVTIFDDVCEQIGATCLQLKSGLELACDWPILCIGAAAAPWLAGSGLQCNPQGFVETGPTLQSVSHPQVFAAGDVATRRDVSHPKSGVYAVRAGPPLAANLRHFMAGGELQTYQPQQHSLALLACGEQRAIASWNRWSFEADWVWRWKNHIDRRFVEKYLLDGV